MIELKDSIYVNAPMDDDLERGFRTAVRNNQVRLALEYSVHLIAKLQGDVHGLKAAVGALTPVPVIELTPVPVIEVAEEETPKKKSSRKRPELTQSDDPSQTEFVDASDDS